MKKTLYTLILSATLLVACTEPNLTPDAALLGYSIIDGDTVKTVKVKDFDKIKRKEPDANRYISVADTIVLYKNIKLHQPPAKDPDIAKLKNNNDPELKGKPLRYVAFGGSITAGVRDGGYFNEGILTSYPNLIARQMKLRKFEQPLFDAAEYNGFGRKVRTAFNPTGGPVPKFASAANNLGIEGLDERGNLKVKRYKTTKYELDNLGIADGNFLFSWGNVMPFRIESINANRPFRKRIGYYENEPIGTTPMDIYLKFKMDLFTLDFMDVASLDGFIPNYDLQRPGGTEDPVLTLLKRLSAAGRKGCVSNIPYILDAPYFSSMSIEDFKKGFVGYKDLEVRYQNVTSDKFVLLPSSKNDSIASPKVHISLKDFRPSDDFRSRQDELFKAKEYNALIATFAKETGYPVVDLFSLYEKIHRGNYYTNDLVKVTPANFYSSDGLFPSAFGQAIIANEFIKTINSFYKTDIPLIPTREYLSVK